MSTFIYHWHPFYIDALGVRMTSTKTHFFLQDANYNVTAAVDDDGNSVVDRYAYTPYGEVACLEPDFDVASPQSSVIANSHLYTGRERDSETGLQLNRNRYYASHLGRWINRDPIEYTGSPYNLYEYVQSDPAKARDPMGEFPWLVIPIIGGACYIAYCEVVIRNFKSDCAEKTRLARLQCQGKGMQLQPYHGI
jgi:RHS repeat-associated protein